MDPENRSAKNMNLKKTAIVLSCLLLTVLCPGQKQPAQITTKKYRLSDFESKVTKVVLEGNELRDAFFKQAVGGCWVLSPFEFCSFEDFERLKTSDSFYFLLLVTGEYRGELGPGIDFITLVKGGAAAKNGISAMDEVASVPIGATGGSGRELIFLPALVDMLQDFTRQAISSDMKGYAGLSIYNRNLKKLKNKQIYLSKGDLAQCVSKEVLQKRLDDDIFVCEEDKADEVFEDKTFNAAVGYVVAPLEPGSGSYCFRMIFDAVTGEPLFFKRHHISGGKGPGFLPEDLKSIASVR